VSPDAAFEAAELVLLDHFSIRTRDPGSGYLRTDYTETQGPHRGRRLGDALGAPRRVRKHAEVRVEPAGNGVNVWCKVLVEQFETDSHDMFAHEHSLSDLPSDTRVEADGATTPAQNAVWRPAGRDTLLERQIRREIQARLSGNGAATEPSRF